MAPHSGLVTTHPVHAARVDGGEHDDERGGDGGQPRRRQPEQHSPRRAAPEPDGAGGRVLVRSGGDHGHVAPPGWAS